LNTPKKPGSDLAALKARLAKKTQGEEPAAAPPPAAAPVEQVHAPAAPMNVPPPGMQQQHYDPPAASSYPHDVPPPGQPAVVGYSAPAPVADDPFGGGPVNTNFDPSPSFADTGGDVPGRSSVGIVLFGGLVGLGIGLAVGWLGQRIVSGNEKVAAGKAKGADMIQQVQGVADTRKAVSLALESAKDVVVQDPKAGAQQLTAIMQEHFDKSSKVDGLFSWQLASIHLTGIKKIFEYYEQYNRLRTDLGVLAGFLEANAAALGQAGGPVRFAIYFGENGAQMAEYVSPLCVPKAAEGAAAPPAEGAKPDPAAALAGAKPCDDEKSAVGLSIRTSIGAEPKSVAKGTGVDQAVPLTNEGTVFTYAVGLEPAKNALNVRQQLMKRVQDDLTEMNRSEVTALKALQNYSDSPTVDGSSEQPAPE
jgi:hypothetical protein